VPGPFHGISTLSSALRSFQRSLDVTGQNIANVNTKGYARQRVELKSLPSIDFYSGGWRQLGSGVTISSISNARSEILDGQMGSALSRQGKGAALAEGLSGIDAIYGEPSDSGLSAGLGRLFDAWSNLAANPSEPAWKQEVQSAGRGLAELFNRTAAGLADHSAIQSEEFGLGFQRLRDLAEDTARLNGEIRSSMALGGSPNELINQRQAALEEMAQIGGATWRMDGQGMATVYLGSEVILQGESVSDLQASGMSISVQGRSAALPGGSLAGMKDARAQAESQVASLDRLANEIRDRVNALHQNGPNGLAFFDPAGSGSAGIRLAAEVADDPSLINAGSEAKDGDGSLAEAIAGLRDESLAGLGGRTIEGFYQALTIGLSAQAESAEGQADIAEAQAAALEARRGEQMGVNLDEEMAEMVKLQRSYQAAARALTTIDQLTEELLGIVR
jgi:flagellar hook-associated protein 1 FlgK